MTKPAYTVTVTREGRYWVGRVQGVKGAVAEMKRLDALERELRRGLALILDVDPDSFDLKLEPCLDERVAKLRSAYESSRRRREDAEKEYAAAAAALAVMLTQSAVSDRDAGVLMGMTHSGVQKIKAKAQQGHQAHPLAH